MQFQCEEMSDGCVKSIVDVKSVNCEPRGLNPLGEVWLEKLCKEHLLRLLAVTSIIIRK